MVTLSWVLGTSANLGIKEVRAVQVHGRVICGVQTFGSWLFVDGLIQGSVCHGLWAKFRLS